MIARRSLAAGLLCATALAACGTVTVSGTTVTVNVAQAVAYSSGIYALVNSFLAFPGVAKALGSSLPAVQTALNDIAAVGPAVQVAAGNAQTFSFNSASPPSFLASLTADLGVLRADVQAAMTVLGSGATPQVTTYYQATLAVIGAITALFAIGGTLAATAPSQSSMSVKDALALVHVKAP